jgi:hypothetical protein
LETSFKIVNAPANLKEAPGTGYPAKGVVLQKMHAVFSESCRKSASIGRQAQFFQVSKQISRVVALQNQVIRGLVDADALGYSPSRGAPDETEGISEETPF